MNFRKQLFTFDTQPPSLEQDDGKDVRLGLNQPIAPVHLSTKWNVANASTDTPTVFQRNDPYVQPQPKRTYIPRDEDQTDRID